MSAAAGTLPGPLRDRLDGIDPARAEAVVALAVRCAAFGALAVFGALHWFGMVAPGAERRAWLVALVALAGGVALTVGGRLDGRWRGLALAGAAVASLGLCLWAAGISLRLLLPTGWGELGPGLGDGIDGIGRTNVPYAGSDPWTRLTILAGGASLVGLAAVLFFWPSKATGGRRRLAALAALIVLFAVPATNLQPERGYLRGGLFLVLVALFLWAPRIKLRDVLPAAVLLAAVALVGMAAAPALDHDKPWVDWRHWSFSFGAQSGATTFSWDQEYGPIDWPRDGDVMLKVHASSRPNYWKAETLDTFDGFRWLQSQHARSSPEPGDAAYRAELLRRYQSRGQWQRATQVTVGKMRGRDLVAPGELIRATSQRDLTLVGLSASFDTDVHQGDTYETISYVPQPTPPQLRRTTPVYPFWLAPYLTIKVPPPGAPSSDGNGPGQGEVLRERADAATKVAHFRSFAKREGRSVAPPATVASSPYRRLYKLSQRLTAGAANPYQATKRIEQYFASDQFSYSEKPPRHRIALTSFVFRDHVGYCQHFSGAMALMLRMAGIPARVAAGFSPGSYEASERSWVVRDTDAHTWVEVFFPDYGWIPFDPTPAVAPARSQATAQSTAIRGDISDGGLPPGGRRRGENAAANKRGHGGSGGLPVGWLVAGGLVLVTLLVVPWRFWRRRATLPRDPLERAVAELRLALPRLGYELPPGSTLHGLEQRLRRVLGPAGGDYVRRLELARYGRNASVPSRPERRAFRRALARGLGPAGRLRALVVFPPLL